MNTVDELLQLLDLEEIDLNLYRGQNYQAPGKGVRWSSVRSSLACGL